MINFIYVFYSVSKSSADIDIIDKNELGIAI